MSSGSSVVSTSSWPRIRHQAGHVGPGRRVGRRAAAPATPGRPVAGGRAEPDDRAPGTAALGRPPRRLDARVRLALGAHRSVRPELRAARSATASGSSATERPDVVRPAASPPRPRPPAAASPARCRGSARPSPRARGWARSVLDGAGRPGRRPRSRAGRARRPAPRRRRRGTRTSRRAAAGRPGRPRPRCRGTRAAAAGPGRRARARGSTRSAAVRGSVCQPRLGRREDQRHPPASASVRPCSASLTAARAAPPGAARGTTSTPTPAGPPHDRASPTSTSQARGCRRRARADGRARRRRSGTPRVAAGRRTPPPGAVGCRPRRWRSGARRPTVPGDVDRAAPRVDGTRPACRPATSSSSAGASARRGQRAAGDEHRGVLDGAGDRRAAAPAARIPQPVDARRRARPGRSAGS